jgi:hypothetical protein
MNAQAATYWLRKYAGGHSYEICYSGTDLGFVGPEDYTILGVFFNKKNTKLRIKNEARQ